MPHCEFFYHNCKKFFDKVLCLVDYEAGEIEYPHCARRDVEQRWFACSAITLTNSA